MHTFCTYDLEIDSMRRLEDNVTAVLTAWQGRKHPSAFERMLANDRRAVQN